MKSGFSNVITATLCSCNQNSKVDSGTHFHQVQVNSWIFLFVQFLRLVPRQPSDPYISCPVSGTRAQPHQGPLSVCRKSHTMTGRLSSTRLPPPHSRGSPPTLSRAAAMQNGRQTDLHLRPAAPAFVSSVCFNEELR